MPKEKEKQELVEVDESETAENYEYAVKIMRRLLQSVGIWPMTSPTYPSSLRFFVITLMCFLLAFFMISVGLYTFLIVKKFKTRVRHFGPFAFGLMNVIKFAILIRRKSDLHECLHWMSSDWRKTIKAKARVENDLMLALASARTGVTFTTACASFMLVRAVCFTVYSGFSFIQERIVVNNLSRMAFAYPGYFVFFNPYDHFYKIYLIQSLCGLAAFPTTAAGTSIAIAFTMHVCGQISVISYMLQNLASGTFDQVAFRYIIEKHLRAHRLAKKLEDLLNGMCLVEIMECCFNICVLGYNIIMVIFTMKHRNSKFTIPDLTPIAYILLVSFTFNIFTFCYVGEQLSAQCRLSIITWTHRPAALTAGKMTIFSIRTFSNVLKTSLSYLNMLRTLTT